jgi:hypothetical protein
MRTTPSDDSKTLESYAKAKPKQFGNLHERMKFLLGLLSPGMDKNYPGLRVAIFDLETEVKHYRPEKTPFGHRAVKTPKPRQRK